MPHRGPRRRQLLSDPEPHRLRPVPRVRVAVLRILRALHARPGRAVVRRPLQCARFGAYDGCRAVRSFHRVFWAQVFCVPVGNGRHPLVWDVCLHWLGVYVNATEKQLPRVAVCRWRRRWRASDAVLVVLVPWHCHQPRGDWLGERAGADRRSLCDAIWRIPRLAKSVQFWDGRCVRPADPSDLHDAVGSQRDDRGRRDFRVILFPGWGGLFCRIEF
mmetsp:Transcript_37152/g.97409  ORF Transcript_37152/g.97409 Transcript_37152/m.97409 type:complete len:217 (+) Transcript_37152:1105-1755(+)